MESKTHCFQRCNKVDTLLWMGADPPWEDRGLTFPFSGGEWLWHPHQPALFRRCNDSFCCARLILWKPTTPFLWVLRTVENCVDNNCSIWVLIENNVGEAPNRTPSIAFVNYLIHPWTSPDELNTSIDTTKKFFAQAKLLLLMPDISLGCILFRFWQNNEISRHHTARCEFDPWLLPMNCLN